MTVKELIDSLKDADPDMHVCVWSWFKDGARIYAINTPCGGPKTVETNYGPHVQIGNFDNCPADRLDL